MNLARYSTLFPLDSDNEGVHRRDNQAHTIQACTAAPPPALANRWSPHTSRRVLHLHPPQRRAPMRRWSRSRRLSATWNKSVGRVMATELGNAQNHAAAIRSPTRRARRLRRRRQRAQCRLRAELVGQISLTRENLWRRGGCAPGHRFCRFGSRHRCEVLFQGCRRLSRICLAWWDQTPA